MASGPSGAAAGGGGGGGFTVAELAAVHSSAAVSDIPRVMYQSLNSRGGGRASTSSRRRRKEGDRIPLHPMDDGEDAEDGSSSVGEAREKRAAVPTGEASTSGSSLAEGESSRRKGLSGEERWLLEEREHRRS